MLRAAFLEEAQTQSRTQAQPEPDISHPEQPASEATEPEQPQFTTETVAVYPGDKNNLPYDVEIRTLHFDEPEHDPPAPLPPAENFRITDDNLGIGGAKAKFRANMAAINLLKELEFEGAQATPEQQEILSRYVGLGAALRMLLMKARITGKTNLRSCTPRYPRRNTPPPELPR